LAESYEKVNLVWGTYLPVMCPSHFCRVRVTSPSRQSRVRFI